MYGNRVRISDAIKTSSKENSDSEDSTSSSSGKTVELNKENRHESIGSEHTENEEEKSSSYGSTETEDSEEERSKVVQDLLKSDESDKSMKESDEENSEESDKDSNGEDDKFIIEMVEKLISKRDKKNNAARIQWLRFKREQKEIEEREKQFKAYWERRHREDKDLWRDKDFANAVDKMSRAGYKGEHGNFEVPQEIIRELDALYMQITFLGKSRIECQKEFIQLTNKTITKYGWNPPEGWR
ncbi:unnamed protein product [Dracunculus medinensis]|uniref:HA domain-containing protein n=1 Tax=Dracunculus medinensis TaxID=318479 RepID=A0A0N4U7Z2_DRAME|nr:unnamed protein product [Dracunculus medinensis]